jgi:hypothetical protein
MPINTTGSNPSSGVLAENIPATTTKGGKSKTSRKGGGSAASRSETARTTSPTEILFKDQPNPYHAPQPPFIWIDHPQERERLLGPVYVIRLGVGGAQQVEISIDGGAWQNCRLTSGYWWFDWSGIQPGKHTLTARMRTTDGRWFRTPARNCDFRP